MKFKKFNDLMLGSQYDYRLWIPSEGDSFPLVDLHSHKYDNYDVKSIMLLGDHIQIELGFKDVKSFKQLCLNDYDENGLPFDEMCLGELYDDIDM